MADLEDTLARRTPAGQARQLRPVERATVRRVTDDGRLRVTLDRLGDRREVVVDYDPQVQWDRSLTPSRLVTVEPPPGTRCVVLFPGRGVTGGVAVFAGRYAAPDVD